VRELSRLQAPVVKKRRGRKFMNEDDRKDVSERMKRYWAKRRETSSPGGSTEQVAREARG
jgi:hypothetical protein